VRHARALPPRNPSGARVCPAVAGCSVGVAARAVPPYNGAAVSCASRRRNFAVLSAYGRESTRDRASPRRAHHQRTRRCAWAAAFPWRVASTATARGFFHQASSPVRCPIGWSTEAFSAPSSLGWRPRWRANSRGASSWRARCQGVSCPGGPPASVARACTVFAPWSAVRATWAWHAPLWCRRWPRMLSCTAPLCHCVLFTYSLVQFSGYIIEDTTIKNRAPIVVSGLYFYIGACA